MVGANHPIATSLYRNLPAKSSQYRTRWPTRLDKIKNLHSTDTIDTENSGTRGRPIWVHSSQVGKADSKWVCHVVPAYPNVSPGPMNGSILLRWTRVYCTANFPLGCVNLVSPLIEHEDFLTFESRHVGTEVPAAWLRQRGGRVDHVGHRLQPAHLLSDVEILPLLQPSVSRSEALSCLVN